MIKTEFDEQSEMQKNISLNIFFFFTLSVFSSISCKVSNDKSQTKIIGGNVAERPMYFARFNDNCGSAFITDEILVTAAHCIEDNMQFVTIERHQGEDLTIPVIAKIKHSQYRKEEEGFDIALIKLSPHITIPTNLVQPISITSVNQKKNLWLTGKGNRTTIGHVRSKDIRKIDLPYIENSACQINYGSRINILDSMICAGDFNRAGMDSCQGDSGGPLTQFDEFQNEHIVGVVSFGGDYCGQKGQVGIYTRLSSYEQWIKDSVAFLEKNLEKLKEEDFKKLVQVYCHSGEFKSSKIYSDANKRFNIQDTFLIANDFKNIQGSRSIDILKECNIALNANNKMIVQLEARGENDFLVTYDEKQWVARSIKNNTDFIFSCKNEKIKLSIDKIPPDIFRIYVNDRTSMLRAVNPLENLSSSADLSCRWGNEEIKFWEMMGKYFIDLTLTSMEDHRKFYELSLNPIADVENADALVLVKLRSDIIHLKNQSNLDLFTWELKCDAPFFIEFSDKKFKSITVEDEHSVAFYYPEDNYSSIKAGDLLEFKSNLSSETNCYMNGSSIQILQEKSFKI